MSNANADMHIEMTAVEGKTAVTSNVAVINPDSVARSKSLHSMLAMLVGDPALDIIMNSGQGEGYESWRRQVLEYDPRSRVACSRLCDGNSLTAFHIGCELVRSFLTQRSQCTSAGRQRPLMMT